MDAFTGMLGIPAPVAVLAIGAELLVARAHLRRAEPPGRVRYRGGDGGGRDELGVAVAIMIAGAERFSVDRAVTS